MALLEMNPGDVIEFNYTGSPETFTLPPGLYKIECRGSVGGGSYPGNGGYTKGNLQTFIPLTLSAYVGGNTNDFNGGARSGRGTYSGGATDIRIVEAVWNNIESLRSRIMVAAGGGTAGNQSAARGGGYGGGLTGQAKTENYGTGGGAGTQTLGGAGQSNSTTAANAGKFGIGGYGVNVSNGFGGAGGSGYYGGGGVYPDGSGDDDRGGGGGSSFISGLAGCNAVRLDGTHSGQADHYSGLIFSEAVTTANSNTSTGKVTITAITIYYSDYNGAIWDSVNNKLTVRDSYLVTQTEPIYLKANNKVNQNVLTAIMELLIDQVSSSPMNVTLAVISTPWTLTDTIQPSINPAYQRTLSINAGTPWQLDVAEFYANFPIDTPYYGVRITPEQVDQGFQLIDNFRFVQFTYAPVFLYKPLIVLYDKLTIRWSSITEASKPYFVKLVLYRDNIEIFNTTDYNILEYIDTDLDLSNTYDYKVEIWFDQSGSSIWNLDSDHNNEWLKQDDDKTPFLSPRGVAMNYYPAASILADKTGYILGSGVVLEGDKATYYSSINFQSSDIALSYDYSEESSLNKLTITDSYSEESIAVKQDPMTKVTQYGTNNVFTFICYDTDKITGIEIK